MAGGRRDQGRWFAAEAPPAPPTRALVVRAPWAGMLVRGDKTWEIRGAATHVRGPIAIAQGGTGLIVGTAVLSDCLGPLTLDQYREAWRQRGGGDHPEAPSPYPLAFAWVMTHPSALRMPIPYSHPSGAVIWVKLSEATRSRLTPSDTTEPPH